MRSRSMESTKSATSVAPSDDPTTAKAPKTPVDLWALVQVCTEQQQEKEQQRKVQQGLSKNQDKTDETEQADAVDSGIATTDTTGKTIYNKKRTIDEMATETTTQDNVNDEASSLTQPHKVAKFEATVLDPNSSKASSSYASAGGTKSKNNSKQDVAEDAAKGDTNNNANSFPFKLYHMLMNAEKAGYENIVSFTSDGTAFTIHKTTEFEHTILPQHFSTNRFASFQRQLNLYGFKRMSNHSVVALNSDNKQKKKCNTSTGSSGSTTSSVASKSHSSNNNNNSANNGGSVSPCYPPSFRKKVGTSYFHPLFMRGEPSSLKNVVRKRISSAATALGTAAVAASNILQAPSSLLMDANKAAAALINNDQLTSLSMSNSNASAMMMALGCNPNGQHEQQLGQYQQPQDVSFASSPSSLAYLLRQQQQLESLSSPSSLLHPSLLVGNSNSTNNHNGAFSGGLLNSLSHSSDALDEQQQLLFAAALLQQQQQYEHQQQQFTSSTATSAGLSPSLLLALLNHGHTNNNVHLLQQHQHSSDTTANHRTLALADAGAATTNAPSDVPISNALLAALLQQQQSAAIGGGSSRQN